MLPELPPDAVWALPVAPHDVHARRLRVLAYDVACPRRWRRLRRAIAPWRAAGQLSVAELHMGRSDFVHLIAEAHDLMNREEDRLASWQPVAAGRIDLGQMSPHANWPAVGHWVFCYDVKEPARLRRVQRLLAQHTTALQRSVYWLRASVGQAQALTLAAGKLMDATDDRLSVYPLQQAGHLLTHLGHDLPIVPVSVSPWWPHAQYPVLEPA